MVLQGFFLWGRQRKRCTLARGTISSRGFGVRARRAATTGIDALILSELTLLGPLTETMRKRTAQSSLRPCTYSYPLPASLLFMFILKNDAPHTLDTLFHLLSLFSTDGAFKSWWLPLPLTQPGNAFVSVFVFSCSRPASGERYLVCVGLLPSPLATRCCFTDDLRAKVHALQLRSGRGPVGSDFRSTKNIPMFKAGGGRGNSSKNRNAIGGVACDAVADGAGSLDVSSAMKADAGFLSFLR